MRNRRHSLEALRAFLALLLATLLLSACGPGVYRWDPVQPDPAEDRVYEVERGDTLYSIAWRYGLDFRALAKHNGIGSDFRIYPGQKLDLVMRVSPEGNSNLLQERTHVPVTIPETTPSRRISREDWRWPANGPVIAKFGDANATGKGIAIGGSDGDAITAAADGKVVYAGSGLIGYGKIIIVKHSEEYLSAYGHNETIVVREGEQVKQGDRIASMGRGPGNRPMLHFEIRINGNAVDPLAYLPSR